MCSDDQRSENILTFYCTIDYNNNFVICCYCNQKFVYNDIQKGYKDKEKLK